MAKSKSKKASKKSSKKDNKKQETVDLSKVETPQDTSLNNQMVLDTIQEMVVERAKENPKHPHVGVNEIATHISETQGIEVDGKDIRRRLQKIRKKAEDYESGKKAGQVNMAPENTQNPYEAPMVIQWANRNNREKGIEYLVTLTDK